MWRGSENLTVQLSLLSRACLLFFSSLYNPFPEWQERWTTVMAEFPLLLCNDKAQQIPHLKKVDLLPWNYLLGYKAKVRLLKISVFTGFLGFSLFQWKCIPSYPAGKSISQTQSLHRVFDAPCLLTGTLSYSENTSWHLMKTKAEVWGRKVRVRKVNVKLMETSSVLDKSCGPDDPFPDWNFLTKRLMLALSHLFYSHVVHFYEEVVSVCQLLCESHCIILIFSYSAGTWCSRLGFTTTLTLCL